MGPSRRTQSGPRLGRSGGPGIATVIVTHRCFDVTAYAIFMWHALTHNCLKQPIHRPEYDM